MDGVLELCRSVSVSSKVCLIGSNSMTSCLLYTDTHAFQKYCNVKNVKRKKEFTKWRHLYFLRCTDIDKKMFHSLSLCHAVLIKVILKRKIIIRMTN